MEPDNEWDMTEGITISSLDITDSYITLNSSFDDQIYVSDGAAWTLTSQPTKTVIQTPLEVNGRDILQELDDLRDALVLLKRDVNMEEKYPELKRIKDEYEAALEKYKTFDAIKESK